MLKFIVQTRKVLGSEHLAVPFRLETRLDNGATHTQYHASGGD